jgi:predicted Zn finger-like uncharacterized protein
MDVRCEKCQTEYELDESRLKPGGVTVKCTNCGHMFKIRKRTPTNVGLPAVSDQRPRPDSGNGIDGPTIRRETNPSRTPPAGSGMARADSASGSSGSRTASRRPVASSRRCSSGSSLASRRASR